MYWAEFFTIVIGHLFAVTSPGPDFAVVMRQSVRFGARSGIWTSLGVGSAILLHVSYCLLGVAFLLSQSPALFNAMKLLAAVYLFYLGVQSIRASFVRPVIDGDATLEPALSAARAFGLGFVTNGLNPKATLFSSRYSLQSSTPIHRLLFRSSMVYILREQHFFGSLFYP